MYSFLYLFIHSLMHSSSTLPFIPPSHYPPYRHSICNSVLSFIHWSITQFINTYTHRSISPYIHSSVYPTTTTPKLCHHVLLCLPIFENMVSGRTCQSKPQEHLNTTECQKTKYIKLYIKVMMSNLQLLLLNFSMINLLMLHVCLVFYSKSNPLRTPIHTHHYTAMGFN